MRKFALAALAVGAISAATHAPAEAHWRGEAGMAVGAARVWALDLPLVPGRSALQRPHRPSIRCGILPGASWVLWPRTVRV